MELKAAGGWKSDSIAQSYVAESNLAKRSVASNLNICDGGAQTKKKAVIEEDSTYGRAVHNIAQQFIFHGTNENCTFHFGLPPSAVSIVDKSANSTTKVDNKVVDAHHSAGSAENLILRLKRSAN